MTESDELALQSDFLNAATAAMTLRELADAWDRIVLPRLHLVSDATRDALRGAYDAARGSLSGV